MAKNNRQSKKKNNFIQNILGLLIIVCFAVSGYFAYTYLSGIQNQYDNGKESLLKANTALKKQTDFRQSKPSVGTVIGKIRIDGKTEDMPIIEGEDLKLAMDYGVGHIDNSAMPGTLDGQQPAFSAHRETFFKPLQNVKNGDIVVLSMPYGTFRYEINKSIIVKPTEAKKVYANVGVKKERIILITCYPFTAFSSPSKRIVFYADLIE